MNVLGEPVLSVSAWHSQPRHFNRNGKSRCSQYATYHLGKTNGLFLGYLEWRRNTFRQVAEKMRRRHTICPARATVVIDAIGRPSQVSPKVAWADAGLEHKGYQQNFLTIVSRPYTKFFRSPHTVWTGIARHTFPRHLRASMWGSMST